MSREEIIQKLLEESKEFKFHYEKHHELDVKISKLEKHYPMTHDLQIQIETLKKEKLLHKDIVESMISNAMKGGLKGA